MSQSEDLRAAIQTVISGLNRLGPAADLLDEHVARTAAVARLTAEQTGLETQRERQQQQGATALTRQAEALEQAKQGAQAVLADLERQRATLQARCEEVRGQITEAATRAKAEREQEAAVHATALRDMVRAREAAATDLRQLQERARAFHAELTGTVSRVDAP